MSDALKCDICGKYYDYYGTKGEGEYNTVVLGLYDRSGYLQDRKKTLDCCTGCMKSIMNHIDSLRNGNGQCKKVILMEGENEQ